MIGLIKKLMAADGRERLQLERQYQQCSEAKAHLLQKFRDDAKEEISTLYSDATFLFSITSQDFLAVSPSGNVIIEGRLADEFAPALEFVDTEEASLTEIRQAIAQFAAGLNAYKNKSTWAQRSRIGIINKPIFDYEKELRAKGFYYTKFPLNQVHGIEIRKNGRKIATANQSTPRKLGDVAEQLFDAVVNDRVGSGLGKIGVYFGWTVNMNESGTHGMELLYSNVSRRSIDENRDYLVGVCKSIIPFLNVVTTYLSQGKFSEEVLEDCSHWQEREEYFKD
ncbi:hypothetical protein [Agrobacterium sp.]|uniref:hypothetical protein n=1 Tax=Agrobacterium sp. TaxID=361 RepID=UPI002896EEA0|nr:hypothetical protein [Agrobacterium sp.]